MAVKPGYKLTEIGVIPEEWEISTLQDACREPITYGIVQCGPHLNTGIPYIRVSDMDEPELNVDGMLRTSPSIAARFGRSTVEEGDLVYALRGKLGEVRQIRADVAGANLTQGTARLSPIKKVLSDYFLWALRNPPTVRQAEIESKGTTFREITLADLRKIRVLIPPLSEQLFIATALSDVDALLDALERLIAKKRDLKQASMQQLLTGQIRLPGFHGEWVVKTLGNLISNCSSGATPRRNQPDFYKGDIRWITSGELNYNVITDTVEKITCEAVARTNLKVIPKGTFLMAITGLEAAGTRGSCGIVGEPSTTNQSCMAVFPTSELVSEYLFHYYVFRGDAFALQYCQGTKQLSYTAKLVRKLPIDIPPTTSEQTAIAAVLTNMDAELAALEQRVAKNRALKQGMMQELLTGRTRLI
ncbi:restriction endonuclease subunit S [Pseudomonas fluorescens]|uniref:restriction endonuclease subunit S n=1 Tax=Pseudomonas fluorescens TaxID=294 RepID=UPI0028583F41|nr:restriction endonuclease subunit S [Pseudomonas fluorescens]MDR6164130.1 type I restriction enzyme S subunit [Pseudomonas fluorescens]